MDVIVPDICIVRSKSISRGTVCDLGKLTYLFIESTFHKVLNIITKRVKVSFRD